MLQARRGFFRERGSTASTLLHCHGCDGDGDMERGSKPNAEVFKAYQSDYTGWLGRPLP